MDERTSHIIDSDDESVIEFIANCSFENEEIIPTEIRADYNSEIEELVSELNFDE